MNKSEEMAELIVSLIQNRYSNLPICSPVSSRITIMMNHFGVGTEGNSVLVEVGGDTFRFVINHERRHNP